MNVVFDDSIFQVDEDKNFSLSVNEGFNSSVTFPSYAESIKITGNPYNFNTPLNIPSTVKRLYDCFKNCYNFNQPVTIPNGVTDCRNMLYHCENYNKPINIPNSVQNVWQMFYACYKFNQPITIPSSVTYVDAMFSYSGFNASVTLSNGLLSCGGMFSWTDYNQPITIPDSVTNCAAMFLQCSKYNHPTAFPGALDLNSAFSGAALFNSPVTIGNNAVYCNSMFLNACSFNRHVFIPEGVKFVSNMFYSATRFNSVVVIPGTVMDATSMFSSINGSEYNYYNSRLGPANPDKVLQQPIYLSAYSLTAASKFFGNTTTGTFTNINLYVKGVQNNLQFKQSFRTYGTKILNIFTDDSSMDLLSKTNLLTNDTVLTWVNDTTNGHIYNTATNIHIYNNWDGTLPSDLNYYRLKYSSSNGNNVLYDEYLERGDNGTFIYGEQKWSNVPNGAPVTNILNNITADTNVYYAGNELQSCIRQTFKTADFTTNEVGGRINVSNAPIDSGFIISGQDVAGVAFRKTIRSSGNQSGHCYNDATFPTVTTTGARRIDYGTPNNGHYFLNANSDVFFMMRDGYVDYALTYREGNVSNGGVRIQTETNASSNFAVNVTIANNEPVTLPYGSASTNASYGGLINVRYASSNWNVTAIAPVTDGINNYSAGQVIRTWSVTAWNALTVWAQ